MSVYYFPRHTNDAGIRASQDEKAALLDLIVNRENTTPSDCRVLIQFEKYTSDYRAPREKKFVVYSRHTGPRTYRAAYATLEAAAAGAKRVEAALA